MKNKNILRKKRAFRSRLKMQGTKDAPRLSIHRSIKHLRALFIDDTNNRVLFSVSSLEKPFRAKMRFCSNVNSAGLFAEYAASRMREKGVKKIIFDRSGYLYHGRVKAFAEALRKGGLEF